MKRTLFIITLSLIITLSNCMSAPMQGIVFTYADHHTYGHSAGNQINSNKILKSGKSCSISSTIAGISIIFYGAGGSIVEAKKDGGITKVAVVDKSSLNVFTWFYRECTIVWGE